MLHLAAKFGQLKVIDMLWGKTPIDRTSVKVCIKIITLLRPTASLARDKCSNHGGRGWEGGEGTLIKSHALKVNQIKSNQTLGNTGVPGGEKTLRS